MHTVVTIDYLLCHYGNTGVFVNVMKKNGMKNDSGQC